MNNVTISQLIVHNRKLLDLWAEELLDRHHRVQQNDIRIARLKKSGTLKSEIRREEAKRFYNFQKQEIARKRYNKYIRNKKAYKRIKRKK